MTEANFTYTTLAGSSGDTTPPEVFINNLTDMEVLAGSHTITVLARDLESRLGTLRILIDDVIVFEQELAPGSIQFTQEVELVNVDLNTDPHVIRAYCSNQDGLETEVSMGYSFAPIV
jgi:Tfp pilus assembly PilM family ATPase